MKFTLSWLKDHLDTTATLDEIATTLSAIGLEVEGIDDPATTLGAFTIARVVEAKPHPNADRLRVLQVEIEKGKPTVEVVCGAPNARAGLIGVFAPLGTFVPGTGITLEARPVRGVVSNGMMVSERELELSEDHEGIIDLEQTLSERIGERFIDIKGLADPVIEIKLTPNRPDCTAVRGVARDLAAAGLGTLKPQPVIGAVEGDFECPVEIRLDFTPDTETACPIFAGRFISGVKNGPAPAWMQQRLTAVGLRTISALVDITNYISLDRGRPLHVYDADKLKGAVRARLGKAGEKFLALDDKTYTVDDTMCVIADNSGVLGLGGIIGGEDTGCTEATTNVLIECAYFDPRRTAASGRKVGVQTDARYRFERGVDPEFVEPGLDLATDMVLKLCGGTPSRRQVAGEVPDGHRVIAFDFDRIKRLAGIDMKAADARAILEALGFEIAGKGPAVKVTTPSWRPDVNGPADLVEEVARIYGLGNVISVALPRLHGVTRPVLTETQRRSRRARRQLAARGMVEAVTWSFISQKEADMFGGGQPELELANPISVEMSFMRPSLLPGLLTAAQRNRNRGYSDVALYEVGQAYRGNGENDQLLIAAGVRTGTARIAGGGRHWTGTSSEVDLYDVKADVVAVLASVGFDASKAQIVRETPGWYHPGRSAALKLGPKTVLAYFGEVHPGRLSALDVAPPVVAFEIFLNALPPEKRKARARPALDASDLLVVKRDFAFVLDQAVEAGDVIKAALGADRQLVTGVDVFDVFEGGNLGEGKKSLAVSVSLQPRHKALTDAEILGVAQKIINAVTKATGGVIRT